MKGYERETAIFQEYLKRAGLKTTSQRMTLAEKIFQIHHHFTVESLMDELRDKKREISKATIYRILSIMVEAGLLAEHNFGQDSKYYEHIIGHEHHDHIICMDCKRIVEFMDKRIEELQEKAARENGFKMEGHSLNIYGKCQNSARCKYRNG